jgi:Reverse transcriptase (RNA-dependent DNA polymerase)/Integrase zinc binding domain
VIFTTLDCNSGYWQIPFNPEDRDKTIFTSHYGIYRFLRLPFGFTNTPAIFQRAIDIILSGVRWKTCLVYLDDVIVFSSDREAHLARVAEVLTVLCNAGLSLKLQNCRFLAEMVNYLGHVFRPGRLGVAEKNTEALKVAPLPRTQTELRSFLGLCNVYRRFIPRFSAIAAPFNTLLCKGMPHNGPDLSGGTQATAPVPQITNPSLEKMTPRRPIRLLTRTPLPSLGPSPLVGLAILSTSACSIPTGRETNVAAVSTEELRREKAPDPTCQRLLAMTGGSRLYDLNDDGLLIRIAPIGGSHQVVVPDSLTSLILCLESYPPAVGHPGAHCMFHTMSRSFFWPRMAEDVYEAIRQCDHCARNRITEKRHANPLRLFPANGPLESVAMDILGPLPRNKARKPLPPGHHRPILKGYENRPVKNGHCFVSGASLLRPLGIRIRSPDFAPH